MIPLKLYMLRKNLCLSFVSLETRTKKLAGGEGEMFLPASGISQNPASHCFLALCATSELEVLCGAAELWLWPLIIQQGLRILGRDFLLSFLQVWVKLWCSLIVLEPCATHDITLGWSLVITWVRQAVRPWLLSYWNRVCLFLCRRWPV